MNTLKSLLSVAMVLGVYIALAQPQPIPPPPPATPIDGGLSLLLAAGGIYGIKKIKDSIKR